MLYFGGELLILENKSEPLLVLPKSRMAKDWILLILSILLCVVCAAAFTAGLWWFNTVKWGAETWSDMQLQELIYTLMMPLDGTNSAMIADHINTCVKPAAFFGVIVLAVLILLLLLRRKNFLHIGRIAAVVAGIIFAVIGFASAWEVLDMSGYIAAQEEYSSFKDENYVNPAVVPLEFPEEKRNLIYIFLESVENTFADKESGGAFEKNVIPELTEISLANQNFNGGSGKLNGGFAMTGGTWTMGAMFSQTTGLPLLIPVERNSMSLQDEFFPGVTSLGDILKKEGYNQSLVVGSDAAFGGRKLYFSQHGDFNMRDYFYYVEQGKIPEDYYVWWGFEDSYLFEFAKEELLDLASQDKPFNMTMLTVDTHFEDGYVCSLCKNDFEEQYSNVYACSSRQVSEFIKWIQKQDFYENTTVVVAGDHKTMDKDYCNTVPGDYDRTAYYTIINSAVEPEQNIERQFSTLDYFPTTLAAMGVKIPGERLGLGVNLFSSEKTLYELYGRTLFEQGLSSPSELYDELTAGIDTNYAAVEVGEYDLESKTIEIKGIDLPLNDNALGAICYVWPFDHDEMQQRYDGEKIGEDDWSFLVPLSDFDYMNGKYHIHIYGNNPMKNNFIADSTMVIDDPDSEDAGAALIKAEAELIPGEYDYATGRFSVRFTNVPDSIVSLEGAVWTKSDQSDLRWYEMYPGEDGSYYFDVSSSDFGAVGIVYNIQAIGINFSGVSSVLTTYSGVVG